MELIKEQEPKLSEFQIAKRPTYLKINLDIILKNLDILKRNISNATEVIAVVKANAYGHGAVAVTRFLEQHGYKHFAVATALEGAELRQAGVQSFIQILGNASPEEIPVLHEHRLIPTVATETFLLQWAEHWHNRRKQNGHVNGNGYHAIPNGSVVIKVDSGMSRNGCQADELPGLIEMCNTHDITVHSIMTHFAQSWDHPEFTQAQLDLFMAAVRPYREAGVKVHVANSGAIVTKLGVDLDYVRPGISMYGQAPDGSEFGLAKTQELGLMPALSWVAKPTLVKKLPAGRVVGYDQTYILKESETIATVPLGYADGYLRNMFGQGYLTTPDGIPCPVVGRISMDAITVKLPEKCANCRTFYVTEANFNEYNSAYAICKKTNTIPYEVCTNLSRRLPRLYESGGKVSLGA